MQEGADEARARTVDENAKRRRDDRRRDQGEPPHEHAHGAADRVRDAVGEHQRGEREGRGHEVGDRHPGVAVVDGRDW